MSNVVALPNYTAPSNEPVPEVVAILEEALKLAQEGSLVGIAMTYALKEPMQFVNEFHAEHGSRHSIACGVLVLSHKIVEAIEE